ncbi:DUF302 domain-containing protein [bacterium]|nr:MAG: DUF302 domain-containing protein [bacterium]
MEYGFSKTVGYSYDEAVEKVTEELKKEGFGVLTSIDVKDTMKKKLDVDFNKYVILGACNPPLAHKALTAEIDLGLLLPCNVIVYENDQNKTVIGFFDPKLMAKLVDNQELNNIADEVYKKLQRVYAEL